MTRGIGIISVARGLGALVSLALSGGGYVPGPVPGYVVERHRPSRAQRKAKAAWRPTEAPPYSPTGSKRAKRRRRA
jgi:hypothetical protein